MEVARVNDGFHENVRDPFTWGIFRTVLPRNIAGPLCGYSHADSNKLSRVWDENPEEVPIDHARPGLGRHNGAQPRSRLSGPLRRSSAFRRLPTEPVQERSKKPRHFPRLWPVEEVWRRCSCPCLVGDSLPAGSHAAG